jgi:predicted DNA-binding transcriptional regulator AlpA
MLERDQNALLRLPQVLTILPVSRALFYAWIKDGRAPKPLKFGKCSCWRYSDIISLIEDYAHASN